MGEVKRGEKSQKAAVLRVETIVMDLTIYHLFCNSKIQYKYSKL